VAQVLEELAGRIYAKTSPVHHFWHTFDLAVTRFSGRRAPPLEQADPVTREAYSHEVISAGFWFGDDRVREPAFYSYTAPEPVGLTDEPLRAQQARWVDSRGAHLALLRYEDARAAAHPRAAVLDFYESVYLAGATRAGWDIEICGRGPGGDRQLQRDVPGPARPSAEAGSGGSRSPDPGRVGNDPVRSGRTLRQCTASA
jgi:hypothetical protein